MTLMLRKLLASSTYAISDTLAGLAGKLEEAERQSDAAAISVDDFAENFELMPEIERNGVRMTRTPKRRCKLRSKLPTDAPDRRAT